MSHPRGVLLLAVGVAVLLAPAAPAAEENVSPDVLAVQARGVLRKHCAACHDGDKARAGLRVLNSAGLKRKDHQVVTAGHPKSSELLQLVECGTMPPGTRPKVPSAERDVLRQWIAAAAPDFPAPYGETYALANILLDVRAARQDGAVDRNPADERYVTLNHLLADEKTAADLPLYRAALTKALNQLSTGPTLVKLTPIDAEKTIFRIKLSELGWGASPFGRKDVNLYDLLLIEYPLAPAPPRAPAERPERPTVAQLVTEEYLATVSLLRPIPYVRGDWLAGVATQSPLYEDLLRLPPTLGGLEKRLGAGTDAARAGLAKSHVLNCDRIVERRPADKRFLWRTYDLAGKTGVPALVEDAKTTDGGGEVIFRLPNGLPGYFVAEARGMRREEIAEATLQAPWNKEGARNGLSCMVCHAEGLKSVRDEARPGGLKGAEKLYPDAAKFAALLDRDNEDFVKALAEVRQGASEPEPLGPALARFKEAMTRREYEPITLVNLEERRRQPAPWDTRYVFAGGAEALARLDRDGVPPSLIPPVDAHGRRQVVGKAAKVDFTVTTLNDTTKKPATSFVPGDTFAVVIENTGKTDLYFEFVFTGASGMMKVFVPSDLTDGKLGVLKPGKKFRFPEEGGYAVKALDNQDWRSKVTWTVFASDEKFPPGSVLSSGEPPPAEEYKMRPPQEYVADRFVHSFYEIKGGRALTKFDPARMVKKTAEFEIKSK
jgi:mono/diheme cytochrome c family protein